MKTIVLLVFASLAASGLAETVNGWITQARIAEQKGDVTAARSAYQNALKLQPNHPQALYLFKELQLNEKKIAARAMQHKLKQVTLPEVDFDRVELLDALEALSLIISKETKKEFSPNFVLKDPKDTLKDRRINLKLKGVPADAVLRMLLEQGGARAKWDTHAIIVEPVR